MKSFECPREQEVVQAIAASRGAHRLDEDLRAHVGGCRVCSEIATLARLLQQDRDELLRDVRVPAAGQVWWRAALRAHEDAGRAARRPIVWLQGLAGACVLGFGAAMAGSAWASIRQVTSWMAAHGPRLPLENVELNRAIEMVQASLPFAAVLGLLLLLTPVVVYFALSDE